MEKEGLGLMDSVFPCLGRRSRDVIVSADDGAHACNNWNEGLTRQNSLIIELLLDLREGLHEIHKKIPNP